MVENECFWCLSDEVMIDSIYYGLKEFRLVCRLWKIGAEYNRGKKDDINAAIDNDKVLAPKYLNAVLHFLEFYVSGKFQKRYCRKKNC